MISLLIATTLIWDIPTTRTDGTALPLSEIDHHELQLDGQLYDTYPGSTNEVDIGTIEGVFRVRTIGIYGGVSDWSNELVVTITRGNPSAPGQLRRKPK